MIWNRGLVLALVAGACWGAGNGIVGFAAKSGSGISFSLMLEIGILNYIGGFIPLFGYLLWRPPIANWRDVIRKPDFAVACLMKTANALFFISSIFFLSVTLASTIENLHVIITAALGLIVGTTIWRWPRFCGAMITMAAVVALSWSRLGGWSSSGLAIGVSLAFLAACTYAGFLVFWGRANSSDAYLNHGDSAYRTLLMIGTVLGILLVIRFILAIMEMDFVPAINSALVASLLVAGGIFSIGLTYVLVAVAFQRSGEGTMPTAAVISSGVSFSVFVTFLFDVAILGRQWSTLSFVSLLLFGCGYVIMSGSSGQTDQKPAEPS
jgi:drug/metabolite transporter (DMT)-like permease